MTSHPNLYMCPAYAGRAPIISSVSTASGAPPARPSTAETHQLPRTTGPGSHSQSMYSGKTKLANPFVITRVSAVTLQMSSDHINHNNRQTHSAWTNVTPVVFFMSCWSCSLTSHTKSMWSLYSITDRISFNNNYLHKMSPVAAEFLTISPYNTTIIVGFPAWTALCKSFSVSVTQCRNDFVDYIFKWQTGEYRNGLQLAAVENNVPLCTVFVLLVRYLKNNTNRN